MGVFPKKWSSSSFDSYERPKTNKYKNTDMSHPSSSSSLNPNPSNYKILKAVEENGFLILKINYPNCTNFEGNKILVFARGVTLLDIVNQKLIDPHFSSNDSYHSPIARFEPSDRGWNWAVNFSRTN